MAQGPRRYARVARVLWGTLAVNLAVATAKLIYGGLTHTLAVSARSNSQTSSDIVLALELTSEIGEIAIDKKVFAQRKHVDLVPAGQVPPDVRCYLVRPGRVGRVEGQAGRLVGGRRRRR